VSAVKGAVPAWRSGLRAEAAGNGFQAARLVLSGGEGEMAQRHSVCQQCELLDRFLSGRTSEVPCIVCDRLWNEATLKRYERGDALALSGWGMMNAVPHPDMAPTKRSA
jgi:hypothetical protein